jgi:hypothetical protein
MIKWNEVTGFSKIASIIFFIGILPILTFCMGSQYGEFKESIKNQQNVSTPAFEKVSKTTPSKSRGISATSTGSYAYADFNFDGREDRALHMGCGNVNCSYKIELFDPIKNTFIVEGKAFEITNPEVNPVEKIVCSSNRGSANTYSYEIYKYEEGSFVKMYGEDVELSEESASKFGNGPSCTLK